MRKKERVVTTCLANPALSMSARDSLKKVTAGITACYLVNPEYKDLNYKNGLDYAVTVPLAREDDPVIIICGNHPRRSFTYHNDKNMREKFRILRGYYRFGYINLKQLVNTRQIAELYVKLSRKRKPKEKK